MIYTNEILFIFIAVLLVCLIGFKKYVWFISLGYGFSISAIGIMLFVLFNDQIDIYKIIGALVLVLYGFRLGGFLAFRELRSSFYNQVKYLMVVICRFFLKSCYGYRVLYFIY